MSDEDDSILDGTVSEVKEAVENMKNPNYSNLLKREKKGKDRKGVREFLESKVEEMKTGTTEEEPSDNDNSFKKRYAIAGTGLIFGLLIGLVVGQMMAPSAIDGDEQQVKENVRQLVNSGGFNGTVDVGNPEVRSGMYYFNVSLTNQVPNGTSRTSYQTAYVTKDGKLLFPENPLMGVPVNIEQAIQRSNQQANTTR